MKHAMDDVITKLIADKDKLKDVLKRIETLTEMYSAETMRHVLHQIKTMVSEALNNG